MGHPCGIYGKNHLDFDNLSIIFDNLKSELGFEFRHERKPESKCDSKYDAKYDSEFDLNCQK